MQDSVVQRTDQTSSCTEQRPEDLTVRTDTLSSLSVVMLKLLFIAQRALLRLNVQNKIRRSTTLP